MTGHHSASPVGPSVQGGTGAAFLGFGTDGNLTKLPALDGLRGLAVLAVVLFHADFGWAKGGFLGVSLFFTLSGYLITSLLIAERTRSSSINLKAFWARRFRRLLPAAWCTLAAIAIIQILLNQYGAAQRLDLLASFGQVANWRFLATGSSYNQLFSQPSPVRHFWSLAIEEQAYLVIPFLCAAALRFKRAPVAALGAPAEGVPEVGVGAEAEVAEVAAAEAAAGVAGRGVEVGGRGGGEENVWRRGGCEMVSGEWELV